ncbi:Cysteine synthase [Clostridium sp. DL-VIII]|nr:aminotransferase class V-fold PLP-dependent enzyme [Clostridium sp. DL-VIII]EHI97204.1 Cysteine synthase [Clostridium sp. DL-VIII]
MKFNTTLLHGNFNHDSKTGATLSPIYQSSAFVHETAEKLEDVFSNHAPGYSYTRINNPTIESFEKRMALLEGGIGAIACASGMAAISNSLLNILKSGDEIVSSSALFGGTIGLFQDFQSFGIKTKYAKDDSPNSFKTLINENTKAVFIETIGNPMLNVLDIKAIADISHSHNIPLIVDNTVATPFLIKPIEFGADIVIHSSSKYINGSGNSISGVIIDSGNFKWDFGRYPNLAPSKKFGRFAYLSKLRGGLFRNLGACLAPLNAFLNSLGLETLGIRMERLCTNALKLAEFLESNPKIENVNYPGLKSSKWNFISINQFNGYFGAILTMRAGSKENAFKIINNLKYAVNATNIGDTRTLVIHPASTIYINSSYEEKENAGIFDDLIRISVGLEDIEDLITDFENAISKI